jgi:molybdate transport system ATP-binding protein
MVLDAREDMLTAKFEIKIADFNLKVDITASSEIVVLFGPSGIGKSTILKSIAGLMTPKKGEIALHGRSLYSSVDKINLKSQHRRVGYVVQDYALFPHMTVENNIGYGLTTGSRELPADKIEAEIEKMLDTMKISHLKNRYPKRLSGGERQRVALARALIIEPELLLLDEPLSALDLKLRLELQEELLELRKIWNIPFILVTHDLHEVSRLEAGKARLAIDGDTHEFTYGDNERHKPPTMRISY